ncbi:MAG TPA: hypothetical protein VMT64_08105 [Candidatus Binataceae bacterium]|nr:hypothetical protein [Candidatus Binataceae bacterium]
MGKLETLERKVTALTKEELADFRQWFAEFDAGEWDRQFEQDANAGKLDAMAEKALRDHAAGKSKEL